MLLKKANLYIFCGFQSSLHSFVFLLIQFSVIQRFDVIGAFGGEETQTVHVANGCECRLVELHVKMFKKAVEEEEYIEADARLRTVGIQHPYRSAVFKHLLAISPPVKIRS